MSKVQILISTYNGEEYLSRLLDSLMPQSYNNIEILLRDDGSKDDTFGIISDYTWKENLHVRKGENLGVIKSFFQLLESASPDADFFAFCDQDDVWEKDKISRAVEHLEKYPQDRPAMYFCRLNVVDENLNHLTYWPTPTRGPSFRNALIENIATGATIVINKAARELILSRLPEFTLMHDWWIYIVISAMGEVVFDEKPMIKYRQHSSNAVGFKVGFISAFIHRLKRFSKTGNMRNITRQAEELYRLFSDCLPDENKKVLERFLFNKNTFFGRLKYALYCDVYRQTFFDNVILRILILLNRI